jgi:hypothetical protein
MKAIEHYTLILHPIFALPQLTSYHPDDFLGLLLVLHEGWF